MVHIFFLARVYWSSLTIVKINTMIWQSPTSIFMTIWIIGTGMPLTTDGLTILLWRHIIMDRSASRWIFWKENHFIVRKLLLAGQRTLRGRQMAKLYYMYVKSALVRNMLLVPIPISIDMIWQARPRPTSRKE